MSPTARLATLALVSTLGLLLPQTTQAAPKVGVVVLGHAGFTEDQADEIAYDVAAQVAQRIDGDAIAGGTVRGLLTEAASRAIVPGCEDQPACGRNVAAEIKADEVLFLVLKRAAKKEIDVALHRVARDPERIPSDGQLRLAGPKAKRDKTIADTVASLYPPGSVKPFVEPAPEPEPEPEAVKTRARQSAPEPDSGDSGGESITRKKWFWPVIVVGGAVVIGGIITIAVIESRPGPTGAPITLP